MTLSADWIVAAFETAAIPAQTVDDAERQALIVRLRERFGVDVTAHAPWDRHSAPDGRQRQDGGELIPAYVGNACCLMFLGGARTVWKLGSGAELLQVLRECPPVEFYVCDPAARYLLCHNHHDFVIGWGEAGAWVEALAGGQASPP